MGFATFLSDIAPLAKILGGIAGQNKANKVVSRGNKATAAETESLALYKALLDPNSPLAASLSAKDRADNLGSFQSQIRTMQTADRRNQAMGRNPTFFNPERADEAVSFMTSRGLPQLDALARTQANNRIVSAAQGISGNIPGQVRRNDIKMAQGLSNAAQQQTLPTQIIDILRGLGGGQQGQQRQLPQTSTTRDPRWDGNIFYG